MAREHMRSDTSLNAADAVRRLAPYCAQSVARAALDNGVRASGDVVEGWAFCGLTIPEIEGRSLADLVARAGEVTSRKAIPDLVAIVDDFPETAPSGPDRGDAMTVGLAARNVIAALVDDGEIEPEWQPQLVASCITVMVFAIAGEDDADQALADVIDEIREQEDAIEELAPTASEIMNHLEK